MSVLRSSSRACRIRLAIELKRLREDAKLSQDQLADRCGPEITRVKVNRHEGTKDAAQVTQVEAILAGLGVTANSRSRTHHTLMHLAIASRRPWWGADREYRDMGDRQKLVANLECGAERIQEYTSGVVPGLLQTEAYARYRTQPSGADGANHKYALAGRLRRQQEWFGLEDASYELVVERQVIERPTAPLDVMADQLRHLLDLVATRTNVSIRVLPVDANLEQGLIPRSPFALYTFVDPKGLVAVLVDTVHEDYLSTEEDAVHEYQTLFDRVSGPQVALSQDDSVKLIQEAADSFAARAQR